MSTLARPESLAAAMRGAVIAPQDPGYDAARSVHNGMIDRRPALIAQCADVADVIASLAHARAAGLSVAVRGGGHSAPGFGTLDDGLVIDLGAMRGVLVDPVERIARVQGGALLGDVDHALGPFGLCTPSGVISTTGVGGITLGGGLGHLTRRFGLAIDNLVAADVVLANGELVRASEDEHPDLFWALRGGGGNFGIAVSLSFRLHVLDGVVAGPTLWDIEAGPEIMRAWDEHMAGAPDELAGFFAFLTVPPGPPFPEELHLRKMCGVVWCYAGADEAAAAEAIGPLLEKHPPVLHGPMAMPLAALNSFFDPLYPKGVQQYWRAHVYDELSDDSLAAHLEHGREMPTMLSTIHVYPIDGAAARVPGDATAWANRDARFSEVILGVDPDPAQAGALRDWVVGTWEATAPYARAGAYLNFTSEQDEERVRASYGPNYDRLTRIKAQYDPENVFRANQNIRPAAG